MTERRYRDDEVRKIFKLATTDKIANAPASPTRSGLTLEEMQSIGHEVGIAPDVVARAAAALDAGAPSVRESLGMPVEVGTIVQLPRALTDREWEMLVGELQRTFRARGLTHALGSSREWRNGNLHVVMEPAQTGYQLRLGTLKGDAVGINALGATGIVAGVATLVAHIVISDPNMAAPIMLGTGGVAAFVTNWLRLPPWARKREAQFQEIAAKVRSMVAQAE